MNHSSGKLDGALAGLVVAVLGGGCAWLGQMALAGGGGAASTFTSWGLTVFGLGLIALGVARILGISYSANRGAHSAEAVSGPRGQEVKVHRSVRISLIIGRATLILGAVLVACLFWVQPVSQFVATLLKMQPAAAIFVTVSIALVLAVIDFVASLVGIGVGLMAVITQPAGADKSSAWRGLGFNMASSIMLLLLSPTLFIFLVISLM